MIKNFKKGLILTSALILSVTAPALAVPQNMQLKTQSVINNNGQNIVVNSTVLYGNKKIRMENEIAPTKNVPSNMGKSTIIYDSANKIMYMMMPQNKTAIKADSETLAKIQGGSGAGNVNTQMLTDPGQIKDQILKQGGKMVGAETVLGYLCDIYQMKTEMPVNQSGGKEDVNIKIWLANKLSVPLKMQVLSAKRGTMVSILAKEVKTGVSIPASSFEVPADYQVTDVQKMMNQMKKPVPATTKK